MDLELTGDVASMRDDGVDRQAQTVGNLLVLQSLYHSDDDVTLSVAECLAIVLSAFEYHGCYVLRNIVLPRDALQSLDGGGEDVVLHLGVLTEPFLVIIDVVECCGELVVVESVGGQVFDDHELQLTQFLVGLLMVTRKGVHVIIVHGVSVYQRLDVGEECLLLVLHVPADFLGIFLIQLHDEHAKGVSGGDALLQLAADEGQLEVQIVGMARLQVVQEGRHADLFVVREVVIPIYGEVHDG